MALGSVLGTIKDAVDARRDAGDRVGVVGITSFRPFPRDAVREALSGARRIVVVEKAFSVGFGGVLSTDVAMATHDADCSLRTVVAGLGGRPDHPPLAGGDDRPQPSGTSSDLLTFLDLDHGVVERERARMPRPSRSGPSAENILRDLGTAPRVG